MSDQRGSLPDWSDPAVAAAIGAWMPGTRWYPLKGQHVSARVERAFELGDAAILLVRAGEALLQVPVAWRDEPGSAPIGALGGRWLVDATADAAAVRAILAVASGAASTDGLTGDAPGGPLDADRIRVIAGEQSNTSIIGGPADGPGAWIAKVFRVVHAGENPDVVVTGALTRAGTAEVPALLAALTGDLGGAHGHLMAVSRFVDGGEDAWALFLDDALAAVRGVEGGAPDARALGRTVALVHRSLALAMGTADSGPADVAAFVAGLEARVAWARAAAAEALDGLGPHLDRALDAIRAIDRLGELQHIHGDLHLGQVLRDRDGAWLLLDFEGEPLRPLDQRLVREPVERDIVGMLRSFDYAGGSAMQAEPGADPQVAADWVHAQQQAFLAGYAAEGGDLDIETPVLSALLLDKALYEVVYELRNRPDWLPVPLAALRRMLQA